MRYLKANTATVVTVWPFLDKTDGVTAEVALSSTACHITFIVEPSTGTPILAIDADATASAGDNDLVQLKRRGFGFAALFAWQVGGFVSPGDKAGDVDRLPAQFQHRQDV